MDSNEKINPNAEEELFDEYIPEDELEEEYEDGEESSMYGEDYDLPESRDGFIDTQTGEVIDRENLTPWKIIKAIAAQTNTEIRDPKPCCKHCHGRGYEGIEFETKSPVPCRCIYPPKTDAQKFQESLYDSARVSGRLNRNQRRSMMKLMRKELRKQAKIIKRRKKRGFYNPPEGMEETEQIEHEG